VSLAAERVAGLPVALVDAYASHVAGLAITTGARGNRHRAAGRFLAYHPDLAGWMRRPTPQRVADLHRAKAWPFISWWVVAGHLRADLELLLAKPGGVDLPAVWAAEHHDEVRRVAEVGRRFGWSANWIRQVSILALATVCLWAGKTLWELSEDDFTAVLAELERVAHVSASARMHARTRWFALQQACYELGQVGRPPRKAGPAAHSPAELAARIRQPEIRREVVRYVGTIATTLRPGSVYARTKAVVVFVDYLAEHHPRVHRRTSWSAPPTSSRSWPGTATVPGVGPMAAAAPSRWSSSTMMWLTCACSLKTSPAGGGRPPRAQGCCSHPTSRGCPSRSHAPCPRRRPRPDGRRRPAGRPVGAHRPAGAAGDRDARG
jgi:hypothetical protein